MAVAAVTRVAVLGAGRIGAAMAQDLAADDALTVSVADVSKEAVLSAVGEHRHIGGDVVDLLEDRALEDYVTDADLVIGAMPSRFGYATLGRLLAAGRRVVDISFLAEDPFALEARRASGALAIVDCGVAPGLSNLLLGMELERQPVDRYRCLVGGLPQERRWPFEYSAPFAPSDVIEEYLRPARFRINGAETVQPALSDVELVDVPGIGTLEAFNTDGLRTLLATTSVPTLLEKTLRWPGHAERMRWLRDAGFLAGDADDPNSARARTAHILEQGWAPVEGQAEFTALIVEIEGPERCIRHTLVDAGDTQTGHSSMARTTGYFATSLARAVLRYGAHLEGVLAPEQLAGVAGLADAVLDDLQRRGLTLQTEIDERT